MTTLPVFPSLVLWHLSHLLFLLISLSIAAAALPKICKNWLGLKGQEQQKGLLTDVRLVLPFSGCQAACSFLCLHYKWISVSLPLRQLWLYRRLAGRTSTPWTSTPIRAWGRGRPITLTTNLCGPLADRWAGAGDKRVNDRGMRKGRIAGGVQHVFEECHHTDTQWHKDSRTCMWTSFWKAWLWPWPWFSSYVFIFFKK